MNNRMIMLLALGFSSLYGMENNKLPVPKVNLKIINKTNKSFIITNSLIYGPGFAWHSREPVKPIHTGVDAHSTRTISFDLNSTLDIQNAYATSLSLIDNESNEPVALLNMSASASRAHQQIAPIINFVALDRIQQQYVPIEKSEIPYSASKGESLQYSIVVTLEGNNLEHSTLDISTKQSK